MTDDISSLLASFWKAGKPAHGLPAAAYNDARFWQVECDTVLAQTWVCVGFVHEFTAPGDVVPISVAGKPLLLLLDAEGEIRAFHNVCRHRCLKLVDQAKNVGKQIRCPYHAWTYDLAGRLQATPHFGGSKIHQVAGFDPESHGLVPVRLQLWHDWIFVNLDGSAAPFEDYAKPLIGYLADLDFTQVVPVTTLDFGPVGANWKFIMENFIEPYHVQFVHSKTTTQPLIDHYTVIDGFCLGSAVDLRRENTDAKASLAVSSRYLTLFPNFVLGRYFPDQLGVYLNVPLGPDRTAQKRAIYTTNGKTPGPAEIETMANLWRRVHKEDHAMCERMHQGRLSPVAATGGVLSPHWEDSVRAFQELIALTVQQDKCAEPAG